MDESIEVKSLTIAPGVIETIVALAVAEVDGVAALGSRTSPGGIISSLGKKHATSGILIYEEDAQVIVDVHVQVFYGYRLLDIAEQIRASVADALEGQANIEVAAVHVTIDAIQFSG